MSSIFFICNGTKNIHPGSCSCPEASCQACLVKDSLPGLLFMSVGDRETDNIKSGLKNMTELLEKKAPKGLIWYSMLTRSADHRNNAEISASVAIGKLGEFMKQHYQK